MSETLEGFRRGLATSQEYASTRAPGFWLLSAYWVIWGLRTCVQGSPAGAGRSEGQKESLFSDLCCEAAFP